MSREEIIRTICHIPTNFGSPLYFSESQRKKISRNMKKLKLEDQIRVDHLIEYFKNHSELIEKWIGYSEDKRGGTQFYFSKNKSGFIFGGYDKEANKSRPILISDTPELPCSLFIIFELSLFEEFFTLKLANL